MKRHQFCACGLFCVLFIFVAAEAAPLYSVTNLGALPSPNNYSTGVSIGNDGTVTGSTSKAGLYPEAFRWHAPGPMTGLGDFPGGNEESLGNGVNSLGHIVGNGSVEKVNASDSGIRAFLWTSAAGMQNLGLPAASQGSAANAVNSSDQVVGHSFSSDGSTHRAFLWTSGSGFQDLGDLAGGKNYVFANDINDSGVVVGSSGAAVGGSRAFRWTAAGGMTQMQDLSITQDSWAQGVNAAGYSVGASIDNFFGQHAVMWNPAGQITDLGRLNISGETGANSINSLNYIVGNATIPEADHEIARAFLWTPTDSIRDLNELLDSSGAGWTLNFANDINDLGQIVGQGIYCSSASVCEQRGYLLTAVPEPTMLSVLILLLPRSRRRVR